MIDWDDAFANGAYIDGAAAYPPRWAAAAAAFRASAGGQEQAYGPHPRETFDLFVPQAAPLGVVVFVHGGYWQKFDKSYWSHLATGPLGHGWAVALPSYTLAPEATLPQITAQIARAVTQISTQVSGPIRLAGHSAGGHLVTRMVCDDTALAADVVARVKGVVSISGLHDLRPLCATTMKDNLRLSAQDAEAESAALHKPLAGKHVTAWVGGHERPEFLRQSALLREAWEAALVVDGTYHHFDVIDGLQQPDSALTRAVIGAR